MPDQVIDRPSQQATAKPVKHLAVVGCGPRGLYCLDSLTRALQTRKPNTRLAVSVFEPCAYPGAGNVYDPRQPHHLRMNFASRNIDAWVGDERRTRDEQSLVAWLRANQPSLANPDGYVPRATVGEYLHSCYCQVFDSLSELSDVKLLRSRVTDLARAGESWHLSLDHGETRVADEVLLTVGHEGWRSSAVAEFQNSKVVVDGVFPTEKHLSTERIPPGVAVGIRGFGLTWIDAALSLTEGRGGEFTMKGPAWTYRPSGREPRVIFPFSRTGRPMLAKPVDTQLIDRVDSSVWKDQREAIARVRRPISAVDVRRALWRSVLVAASQALRCINEVAPDVEHMAAWFEARLNRRLRPTQVVNEMKRSVEIATGVRPPDAAWALGEAWRQLYPAFVESISHGGLSEDGWQVFRPIEIEMERLAFGPPAENVGRILALVDCGLIDLKYLRSPSIAERGEAFELSANGEITAIDRYVNAVIASPLQPASDGPVSSLQELGVLQRLHRGVGFSVDDAGRPITADSDEMTGLAVLGRTTEGCVLGNDTLSRKLHRHDRAWAESVVHRYVETDE